MTRHLELSEHGFFWDGEKLAGRIPYPWKTLEDAVRALNVASDALPLIELAAFYLKDRHPRLSDELDAFHERLRGQQVEQEAA